MDIRNVCRTCLRSSRKLLPLFADTKLPHKIKTISLIEVSINDKLPDKVCAECVVNINLSYNFRRVIINSFIELRDRFAFILKEELEQPENSIKDIDVESSEDLNTFVNNTSKKVIKNDAFEVEFKDECTTVTENLNVVHKGTNINVIKQMKSKQLNIGNKLYKCDKCNFESLERRKYKIHLQNHITKMCPICGKFIGTLNYIKHINSHNNAPVACKECGKVCTNKVSLGYHQLVHKKINRTCKICGEAFYSRKSIYMAHLKTHKSEEEKGVKCTLCDKILCNKVVLKRHMRSHTGERPYPCEFCKKGFSSSYALKTHRRQHTNERPYLCELCSMAFPQKVSLRTHLKSKHQIDITSNNS